MKHKKYAQQLELMAAVIAATDNPSEAQSDDLVYIFGKLKRILTDRDENE